MMENKKITGREFSNVFIEIDGKLEQLRDLPIHEYEEFLEAMHKLRLVYMSVMHRPSSED